MTLGPENSSSLEQLVLKGLNCCSSFCVVAWLQSGLIRFMFLHLSSDWLRSSFPIWRIVC